MKVVHFDSSPDQARYQTRPNETYIPGTVNAYLAANGNLQADVISCFDSSKFPMEVIERVEGLKFIVTRGIGLDHLDREFCNARGIKFCNIEYPRETIAHHTWALILFAVRHLEEAFAKTKGGEFSSRGIECKGLPDMTLGIVGYGKIGQEVAKLAKAFGIKILATDRHHHPDDHEPDVDFVSLDTLLERSDIVTLHCDSNPSTHHLLDDRRLTMMKEGAILVNTSRGALIDEAALVRHASNLSAIMLDVLADERKAENMSSVIMLPNVHVTPHMAHKSETTVRERWEMTYRAIDDFAANYVVE